MKKNLIFLLLFFQSGIFLKGQEKSAFTFLHRKEILKYTFIQDFTLNPALKNLHFMELTDIQLSVKQKRQVEHLKSYDGTNETEYGFLVESTREVDKLLLWGATNYLNTKLENKQWCNVANQELLYPYFLADSIGGDSYSEKYFFKGGGNLEVKKYNLGLEVTYKAENHHRKLDPRPRNDVLDISSKVGLAKKIDEYNILGASVDFRYYKQFIDIKCYKKNRHAYFYYLKGFGQEHPKLSITGTIESCKYFMNTLGGSIDWMNTGDLNIHAQFTFNASRLKQIYEDGNNVMTPFLINSNEIRARLMKGFKIGGNQLYLNLQHQGFIKRGTENVYESVKVNPEITSLNSWQKLAEYDMFSSLIFDSNIEVLFLTKSPKKILHELKLKFGHFQKTEEYLSPNLHYKYSALHSGLKHHFTWYNQTVGINIGYGASYKHITNKNSGLKNVTSPEKRFHDDIENEMSNALRFNITFKADFVLKNNKAIYFNPQTSFTKVGDINSWNFSITTGFIL